jgi:hypothetical protein
LVSPTRNRSDVQSTAQASIREVERRPQVLVLPLRRRTLGASGSVESQHDLSGGPPAVDVTQAASHQRRKKESE